MSFERRFCGPRARVGDDSEDDPVELDLAPRVVELRLVDNDPVAGRSTRELERSDAHRRRSEPRPELGERLRRHDHSGAIGQLGRQRRKACVELQSHREVVHDVDRRDRRDLAGPRGPGQGSMPVERGFHRLGVQRRSVVEADAAANPDRHRLLVAREPRHRGRELRNDLELRVQVIELLAHVQKDHPSDERPRQCRIERVRVFGQSDGERPAGS